MNDWIKKSIQIANEEDYLDRLHKVYPVTREKKREISPKIKEKIREAYDRTDKKSLVKILLDLDKFPIKDPYVAFLRKDEKFLELNPQTVNRLADTILSMEYEEVIDGIEEPKEFNRQIGALFHRFLPKLEFPFLPEHEFKKHEGIAFLKGSENALKIFANEELGCNLNKGPDLLAKARDKYVLGETKFLTDLGGHQNAQFEDALRLLRGTEGEATRIAVLDGVVWIRRETKMFKTVSRLNKIALSALLLKEFFESLR